MLFEMSGQLTAWKTTQWVEAVSRPVRLTRMRFTWSKSATIARLHVKNMLVTMDRRLDRGVDCIPPWCTLHLLGGPLMSLIEGICLYTNECVDIQFWTSVEEPMIVQGFGEIL